MKKFKRVLAFVVIIFLVALYVLILITALTSNQKSNGLFMASVYAAFIIPVLIWAGMYFYKIIMKKVRSKNDNLSSTNALPENDDKSE